MADRLYLLSNTAQSVGANAVIPLTTIERRQGTKIDYVSNGAMINAPGYYKVEGTVVYTVGTAGNVSLSVQKNDVEVQSFTTTITSATSTTYTIHVSGLVRVFCNERPTRIQLLNSGVAINLVQATMYVGN